MWIAEAIQLHGSYGMTMACDAQRFYRRAVVDGIRFGTGRQLRREAMALMSGPPSLPVSAQTPNESTEYEHER